MHVVFTFLISFSICIPLIRLEIYQITDYRTLNLAIDVVKTTAPNEMVQRLSSWIRLYGTRTILEKWKKRAARQYFI